MRLLSELRRRNVFRMAALYVVAAWLILQVAEVLITLAALPNWTGRVLLVVLVVGFPIALILSWFFALTPQGISLEEDADAVVSIREDAGRRIDFIVIALLSAAVILFAWHTWWPDAPTDRSIAVLAFENIGDDPEQEFFSDGIAEELLNTLAKVSDLRVISRSSSFSFKGKDVDIPTIAKQLNVAHVLEGSVRKMGNDVRITAQLVDARNDSHRWSETYDRELTTRNIFAIQSEIASAIARELEATLSQPDERRIKDPPTMSLDAYQSYLLGKQRMISRASSSLEEAAGYFQGAVEIDPGFALAYVGLAETYMLLGDYAGMSLADMLANAEPALDRALELDERLAEAYVARGAVRSKAGDLAAAIRAFERGVELDPGYSKGYHWYGDVLLVRMRQPDAALPLLQRAYELDPVSPALIVTVGQAHADLGQFQQAMQFYNKALEIEPAYASTYYLIGALNAHAHGRLDLGVRWSLEAAARDPRYVVNLQALGIYYLALGDAATAEHWIDRAISIGPDRFVSISATAYLNLYRGQVHKALDAARQLQEIAPGNNTTLYMLVATGRYGEALQSAAGIYPELACDREPEVSRLTLFPAINLSLALRERGKRQCASRLLDEALEAMQSMPRLGPTGYGFADVEVYASQGRIVQALNSLRLAVDDGARVFWWAQAERSPHVVALRDEEEFQSQMDEIRADMAGQLETLHRMESDGELASVPR